MFDISSATGILYLLVVLIISVGIHEAMHALVAYRLGDRTAADMGRITLNPLAHIDLFATVLLPLLLVIAHLPPFFAAKPVPFNPAMVKWDEFGAALVGVAGPLTNLVLAAVGGLLFQVVGVGSLQEFLVLFVQVNVALFVFNMIPFPPLDGSRLLYAFAPEPLQNIMASIERLGLMAIVIFMVLFFGILGPIIIDIDNALIRAFLGV